MSPCWGVRVWKVNLGTSTLITFSTSHSKETRCFGASRAVFSAASCMEARASMNSWLAAFSPCSTFWRRAMFSRTRSRNWRISSSRLSFSSLWPRVAVASFFFRRVSSMRVGFTCKRSATGHSTFPS